jgi:resuscitation-promoting factor RpfA
MLRRVLGPAATVGALLAGARLLVWGTRGSVAAVRDGAPTFDDLLTLLTAAVAWAVLAWVAVVLAITALTCLPGVVGHAATGLAARVTPLAVRRAARLAVGLAVASGPVAVAVPAMALPTPASVSTQTVSGEGAAPGLPGIGRPGHAAAEAVGSATAVESPTPRRRRDASVVVTRGDCLWDIAAGSLGPGASDAEIAAEWPRWYDTNRDVVGGDPDLIQPGMVLRPPAAL